MMMIKILLLNLALFTFSYAQTIKDQDMDGVPDGIDQCLNTPFLNQVNDKGCSTKTLLFPEEKDHGSLDVSFGYGFSSNEDLIERDTQHTTKLQVSYYLNNWSYTLRTGYFNTENSSGMEDTTFKIKQKIKVNNTLKVGLGVGVKLPTYDFTGNKTDYTIYGSMVYYPKSALSIFMGVSHTFINDNQIITPLQDINTFYIGSGYFFSKKLYINIAYSNAESKFTTNQAARSVISTILYRIDEKWFTTLSYSHEIEDQLNHAINVKFGYSIW